MTLILRIDELDSAQGGYPVRLIRWPYEPLAQALIPQLLQPAGMAYFE